MDEIHTEANCSLGEKVCVTTAAECARNYQWISQRFIAVVEWISENVERDEKSLTLVNFLVSSASYLNIAAKNVEEHISIIALATRNLYEINLQTRDVLRSHEGFQRWQGEALTDKIQVLEGILSLETVGDNEENRRMLLGEIERLSLLREKYNLPDKRPAGASMVAKSVGLAKEHDALFKLFSKLVHPSSYLVNDYENAASDGTVMTLNIHAQLYAGDTFTRICDALSVPESAR